MKNVLLTGGFGNRLNNILNYIEEDVLYMWEKRGCKCKWEDLFKYPRINIIYKNKHKCANYDYHFKGMNDSRKESAIKFINSFVPTPYIYEKMNEVSIDGLPAYFIRSLHPKSIVKNIIKVPGGYYLSTDSKEQRIANPQAIQINTLGGNKDKDHNLRSGKGLKDSIADWFNLMKCKEIYEFGIPFKNMTSRHSTFIDAHRILGMNIIQGLSE